MKRKTGHASELFLLVGLLVPLFWTTQGKVCSLQADCMPVVDCHLIPWTCNGSNFVPATLAPTADPSTQRCCIHLDTCGGQLEVAGWINVRNSTVTMDDKVYKAEWLDTFIAEGNVTQPGIIKSAYVGSWNTLKLDGVSFPSQMFVAEPSNSCTVDGVAKWPEWYQVTANILTSVSDDTLGVETLRDKDCLCDAEWDCLENLCHVATVGMSSNKANLTKPDVDIEDLVFNFCQFPNVTITNYTASSYFAVGFVPGTGQLDSFNYSISVEGGWAPDLEDETPWFEILFSEDTMISGIETQGVATNPERRVDQFQVEYESSAAGAQTVGPNQVFSSGARLDTKTLNLFPAPVKANRIRLLIEKPCDAYYVGLRVGVVGCAPCSTDGDCTVMPYGVCAAEQFCTYEVPTTLAATTNMPTTGMPTTTAKMSSTAAPSVTTPTATASPPTTVTAGSTPSTTQAPTTTGPLTTKPPTTPVSNPSVPTTAGTTVAATTSASSTHLQTVTPTQKAIENKILEFGSALTEHESTDLNTVLSQTNPDTSDVNVTDDFIFFGLVVILNITSDANSSSDQALLEQILKGSLEFFEIVSESQHLTAEGDRFADVLDGASNCVDYLQESVNGQDYLTSLMTSVETASITASTTASQPVTIQSDNVVCQIVPYDSTDGSTEDYNVEFQNEGTDETTVINIDRTFLDELDATEGTSVVIVAVKIKVPNRIRAENSTHHFGSDIISISPVVNGTDVSVPVQLVIQSDKKMDNETKNCVFWDEKITSTEEKWSTRGCVTKHLSDVSTQCTCSHTTNYAVLMWLGEEPMKHDGTLDTITQVGCLVSIIALIVALGLLAYLKSSLSSERIIIHMHLMGVTLVALIIFLSAVGKTDNKPLCQFITIALHFFYMSMFSWMLVEGIHLYRQIVAVFETGKSRLWIYFVIGWGIPVIVVAVSTAINFNKYGTHEACWLSVKDGSLWAFIGPMIPICLANLVVLFMVCRIVVSAAKMQSDKPGFNSAKAGVRSSLLLLPILGVTWIFGYFSAASQAMMYTFVALNSFQGFFMALFHCFMSGEVNTALKQKIRKVKDSSIGGSSSVDSTSKPAMFTSGGMRKVKVSPTMTEQTEPF